jgi:hypothetical protein
MVSLMNPNLPMTHLRTKIFQLRINQLFVWFTQVHVNNLNCLSIFLVPSRSFNTPFYPWNVVSQGAHLTPSPSIVFIFGFVIESIKELGGASRKEKMRRWLHKLVRDFPLCKRNFTLWRVSVMLWCGVSCILGSICITTISHSELITSL